MMNSRSKMAMPLLAALLLGACGGVSSVCEKPRLYQQSAPGKRIEVPEGLDSLQPSREMTIPDASPRDPRPAGAPCLELPPTFGTGEE
jgi:uncharacterized lipoprotein